MEMQVTDSWRTDKNTVDPERAVSTHPWDREVSLGGSDPVCVASFACKALFLTQGQAPHRDPQLASSHTPDWFCMSDFWAFLLLILPTPPAENQNLTQNSLA
jgi:hypothetical protein